MIQPLPVDIFNGAAFIAYCAAYAGELPAVEAKCQDAAKQARDLLEPRDMAVAERNRAEVQRAGLYEFAKDLRADLEGKGSLSKFRAILEGSKEEQLAVAGELARERAVIQGLRDAVEHHDRFLGPKLGIASQQAEVNLMEAFADMCSWSAVVAGVRRAIASQELAEVDGQVAFSNDGPSKTNNAIATAADAKRKYHSAVENLKRMEREFQEPRGN